MLPSTSSSPANNMLCRSISREIKPGKVPVYLNVYDLTSANGYAYWVGLGAYHSGVQVHGVEYAFGAHEQSSTGVFEVKPKQCPGFTFRKSILIGRTDLEPSQVRTFMEKLSEEYHGNTYNLIAKNCNHFCNDACLRLIGRPIPSWVNRLARLGVLCNCVLPASLNVRRVEEEKKKLRGSRSKRFSAVDETASFRSSKSKTSSTASRLTSSECSATASVKVKMMREVVQGIKC